MEKTQKKIASIRVVKAGSAPDVDSDFHTAYRDSVLEHCEELYGRGTLSNIVTFSTLAAKAAFKIMCTIYSIPFSQANKIASLIPGPIEGVDCTIDDIFDPASDRYSECQDFRTATAGESWRTIIDGAIAIEGRVRATGVHPCGVVISSRPLIETIPLQVRQSDGRVISQWTYKELEALGLLKFDFLGLDTVDLISQTVEYIQKSDKPVPNMLKIIHGDMDDKKTFEMLSRGETDGIFQLASPGVKDLLRRMKPTHVEDIIATTALYRPGPMGMNSHIKYADRKNGKEKMEYPIHPDFKNSPLEQILEKTYGLCVPEGTPILNSVTGLFEPIEKVSTDGSFLTPSFSSTTEEVEAQPVSNLIATGNKEVLRIIANGNRRLEVAGTHPILTPNGYVAADKLKSGDLIASSSHEKKVVRNFTSAEDRAWLLGAFLGDGSITGTASPYFTSSEEELRNEFSSIIAKEFPGLRKHETIRTRDGEEYTRHTSFPLEDSLAGKYDRNQTIKAVNRHPIVNWLTSLGYKGKVTTYQKSITREIFMLSDNELVSVIAGLWDTDGTVGKNRLHFTTISNGLFTSMCLALQRLGVDYSVSVEGYENAVRADAVAYRVRPTEEDFTRIIQPFLRSSRRANFDLPRLALNKETLLMPLIMKDSIDFLLANPEEFVFLSSKGRNALLRGDFTSKMLTTYLSKKLDRHILGSYSATKVAALELGILTKETRILLNLRWRRIKKIESLGKKPCYDIEVAVNHNFFVAGFITHNCVYQEQIMQIANQIGGMTLQQGDDLRSAMGKKKKAIMAQMKPLFLTGGTLNNYSEEALQELWATMEVFAEYGFNKAHSVAYAINAYQSAYLKAHYPIEFMAALISQNVGRKEKILAYLQEAKRMKLKVGSVNINVSDVKVAPDYTDGSPFEIVYGFSGINAVSTDMAKLIVQEREENGLFESVQDTITRCSKLGVTNKKIYENLALAGAFDHFGIPRRGIVENLTHMIGEAKTQKAMGSSLFDMFSDTKVEALDFKETTEYPHLEKLKKESDVIGLYLTSHPLSHVGKLAGLRTAPISKVLKTTSSIQFKLVGAITEIAVKRQKRGGKSIAITLDDGSGFITAFLNKNIVKGLDKRIAQTKIRSLYEIGAVELPAEIEEAAGSSEWVALNELEAGQVYSLTVNFRPAFDDNPYSARITSITKLALADDGSLPVRIRLNPPKNTDQKRNQARFISGLASAHPGSSPIFVAYKQSAVRNPDAVFLDAMEVIKADESFYMADSEHVEEVETLTGSIMKKSIKTNNITREWPPPKQNRDAIIASAYRAELTYEDIEKLQYRPTKFRVSKNKELSTAIEEKIGIENYDFGVFNPELLEDS